MNQQPHVLDDQHYQHAITSVERTLDKLRQCSPEEKKKLHGELRQLQDMLRKLTSGRIEIAVFGEISTGKSALINALVGQAVAQVDVQGGWTKEVWHVAWQGSGYCVPGLADSQVVLVDTPGLNEVGGQDRGQMANQAAQRADLILFVTDSDLNETEYSALAALARVHKPIILVLNKVDLYSREQRARLWEVLRDERVADLVPPPNIVLAAADPREVEYVIEAADGTQRREWRKPDPDVEQLKVRILEVLAAEGKELLTLNAAMYAADKSDRIASVRISLRDRRAKQVIASYAGLKAVAVAFNPVAVADVLGGTAVDMTMVITLAHIYGLELSTMHARSLITSIVKAAGWVMLGEMATHVLSSSFKGLTLGYGTVLTAVPQGAAAGYGSFVVGQAAKYYFEHGSSWGGEAPKTVVHRILQEMDKSSVLEQLKNEIKAKMHLNPHAGKSLSDDE
ncbi:MAG: YcjF family protein [Pirellulaceae bacterium]